MRARKKIALACCVLLLSGLLFPPAVHAYLSRVFNAKELIEEAQVVCHVRILSVERHEIEKESRFQPPLATEGAVARARVVGVVKGQPADTITILFRRPTSMVDFTQLCKGEECIAFLRPRDGHYRFIDEHNGKLAVPPHEAIGYRSESPADRMVEELVYATRNGTGAVQLTSIRELGNFAHDGGLARLRELSVEQDMAVQGTAYAALVRLDHPPSADDLVRFFARPDETRSLERFGTTLYSNGHLKRRILAEMDSRFNVIGRDFRHRDDRGQTAKAGAARWKDFDLIGFLDAAHWDDLDFGLVRIGRCVADIVGNQVDPEGRPAFRMSDQVDPAGRATFHSEGYRKGSRRIVVRLLGSADGDTRLRAAWAVAKMIALPRDLPYPRNREKEDLDAFIDACRDWVATHNGWAEEK